MTYPVGVAPAQLRPLHQLLPRRRRSRRAPRPTTATTTRRKRRRRRRPHAVRLRAALPLPRHPEDGNVCLHGQGLLDC